MLHETPSAVRSSRHTGPIVALAAAAGVILTLIAWWARSPIYQFFDTVAAAVPSPLDAVVEHAADVGLVVLAILFVIAALAAMSRRRRNFWLAVATGAMTVAAYAISELVKVLIEEKRPCRVETGIDPISACPPPGDWSWPSNHATIAAGLAVAIIFLIPRLWRLAMPVAVIIGLARVLQGVHYLHDVLAGFLLGGLLVAVIGWLVLAVRDRRGTTG